MLRGLLTNELDGQAKHGDRVGRLRAVVADHQERSGARPLPYDEQARPVLRHAHVDDARRALGVTADARGREAVLLADRERDLARDGGGRRGPRAAGAPRGPLRVRGGREETPRRREREGEGEPAGGGDAVAARRAPAFRARMRLRRRRPAVPAGRGVDVGGGRPGRHRHPPRPGAGQGAVPGR